MAQITPLGLLKGARKRITDIEHWYQGSYAIDHNGMQLKPTAPEAYAFCALGSLYRSAHQDSEQFLYGPAATANAYLEAAARDLFGFDIVSLNDGYGFFGEEDPDPDHVHAQILKVYDKAIERAKVPLF